MQNLCKENKIAFVVFLQALSYGLAIAYGDTTLAPRIVPSIIAGIHYVLALYLTIALFNRKKYKNSGKYYKLLIVIIVFLISNFNLASGESRSLVNYIGLIPLIVFCYVDDILLIKAVKYFEKFMVMSSLIGIIAFILCLLGVQFRTVPFYSDRGEGVYVDYFISYVLISTNGLRICGLFNEPGFYGTIAAFFIIINKFNFRRQKNILLLLSGILTLSMAFYVLVIGGYLVYSLKNAKQRIIAILLVFTLFWIIQYVHTGNVVVDKLIERFQYDKDLGTLKGDNRGNSLELKAQLAAFYVGLDTMWGYGTGYTRSNDYGGVSTPLTYVLDWGYAGMALTFGLLSLFAILLSRKNKYALIFVIFFIVSIYQRPNVFSMEYLLILFGGIQLCIENERQRLM